MIEHIWLTFHKRLLGFITSQVNDKDNAEDILQNVFIKVLKNLHQLTDNHKLQPWLYQICRHAIIDFYRSQKNSTLPLEQNILDALISEDKNHEYHQQFNQCMSILLDDLPDNISTLLKDSDLEEMKQKDLAKKYNLSLSATKSRILRGRALLKKKLSDCCEFEFSASGPLAHCKKQCGCQ